MKTALILVDIQNDYFPGGRMELVGIERASANARDLLSTFRDKRWPIMHIQHVYLTPDAPFFSAGTEGVRIHESVAPLAGETVIEKHFPNGFRASTLLAELQKAEVDSLVICGAMSHMCIDATTRHAVDLGLSCTLVHDACATRDVEFAGTTVRAADVHAAFMSALGWGYARLTSARDFMK